MAKEMTWKKAIEEVLRQAGSAMDYKEIADQIITLGLRKSVGATPAATVSSNLVTSIKNEGTKSPFLKVGRGQYFLNQARLGNTQPTDEIESPQVITSFGMFWRRDMVHWTQKPRLLGVQKLGAESVDFCNQQGIYLLYDGREIVYVGRTTDRTLGRRLYEHTLDRLSTRWDRFSWFGLLPVLEKGDLTSMPSHYNSGQITPALEAILIEALEPRQNRKRGDDLSAVEFLQQEDPEVKKRRIKETIENILNRA